MEEVKKEGERERNGWGYSGRHHAFAHFWWIKSLVAFLVLLLVFWMGVEFGEHHSWYGRDFGGRFGGQYPMMYQEGNYAQPQNGGSYHPGGMMQWFYRQNQQNQGVTTTPQTTPGQQP